MKKTQKKGTVPNMPNTATSGWREWLALPEFNIHEIEGKIDTGTETSVLHTSFIEHFRKRGRLWVRFGIHPLPDRSDVRMIGFAPVKERLLIKDTEGHSETCFVIETKICLGEHCQAIKLSLTEKDSDIFRIVLGRSALKVLNILVDSSRSYLLGQSPNEPSTLTTA